MKFDHLDLCLLRHGQTQWNLIQRVQGRMDSNLTPLGKSQALRQGEILFNQKDTTKRAVFCSPTGRARETAELIFQKNDLKCTYDERLVEISVGDWQGQLQSDIQRNNPALFLTPPSYLSLYGAAPNGEGIEALRNRCIDFLSTLDSPSIVISHGVTITMMRGILLNLSLAEMEHWDQKQGCVIRIDKAKEELLL